MRTSLVAFRWPRHFGLPAYFSWQPPRNEESHVVFQATPHEREVGMPHPRYESLCHLVRCCTKFCFKFKYFPSFCLVPQVFVLESVYLFFAGFKQFETKCLFFSTCGQWFCLRTPRMWHFFRIAFSSLYRCCLYRVCLCWFVCC